MSASNHAAAYTAFKDFYQEELDRNPFYRYMVQMLRRPDCLPPHVRTEAVGELHDFEHECFQTAFFRLNILAEGHAHEIVKPNDFFFFRTAFETQE
ncbi:Uncharacterised protein [Kingella potus]|uniref:Uncharacterized protein n=1 Tax=Kingella potus TaxID=265175 RepID=A0A377R451_9NEIS|nr:hypothetical protein [Kingella potus]UOO99858.1 hypothetical protein LVJ84_07125 [Kingella potus]STR03113.1 Uncharacterised protein [Kingella potus]